MRRPRRAARWLFAALAAVALALLLAAVWRAPALALLALFTQRERLQALIGHLGPFGPLGLIALQAAQVIVAPIPGQALGLASGYLYGTWLGTLYSMVGVTLGTGLAVGLARRWGRPLVERLLSKETLARVDRACERLGLPLLLLVFLLPFLPDDAIALASGLTDIPLAGILITTVLGRLPGVLVSAWIGANAASFSPIHWAIAAAVALIAAIPLYRKRESLERTMWSLAARLGRRSEGAAPPRERENTDRA